MLKKLFAFFIFLTLCAPSTLATTSEGCTAPNTNPSNISTSVRISALYPNPNSGETEWIELTNTGSKSIELSNYTLEDSTAKPWAPIGSIEAGETFEVNGFPFQLNNSNETVTLKTNTGAEVDTWTYASSEKGVILTRETQSTETSSPSSSETSAPDTVAQTPVVNPSLWPDFSEAMPNPEGSDSTEEWIELYNPHAETLNLSGLSLDDAEGGSSPHALSGTLAPETYLLIGVEESHINLNNTEDHVRLLGVNGEILWDYTYSDPKEGESLILSGSEPTWTSSPSPGEENVKTTAPSESSSSDESSNTQTESTYQNGDLSEEVTVTEVFPNPEGPDNEEEWIELTNGGSEAVNLGNWTLMDASGKTYTFPDSTIVKAGETLVIYRTESKISLNNSNESVALADYTGEILSEVSFESSQEDESYSEIQIEEVSSQQASTVGLANPVSTIWQWVAPSPGVQNPIWKQIKGSVTEFDGSLLTLFDGISTWTFTTDSGSTDELLYKEGNTLLVQATLKDQLYKIMHAELLEGRAQSETKAQTPWSSILSITGLSGWGAYELYKRRKTILNFRTSALN